MPKNAPQNIDKVIGNRLKLLRLKHGLSIHNMADIISVCYQQYDKYERGINRLYPSALYKYSLLFEVPIEYFFKNSNEDNNFPKENFASSLGASSNVSSNEISSLIRHYRKIKKTEVRKSILDYLSTLV